MSVAALDPVQPESFAFSAENLAWAKKITGNYPAGKQASGIPLLWRAQEQNGGWVTRPAIESVGKASGHGLHPRAGKLRPFTPCFSSPGGKEGHLGLRHDACILRGAEAPTKFVSEKSTTIPHHLSSDGNFPGRRPNALAPA